MNSKVEKHINIIEIVLFIVILGILIYLAAYYNSKREYQVTFITNTNTEYATQMVKKGNKLIIPDPPVKESYTFIGWEYEGDLYDFEIPVKDNMKLVAIFEYDELK